jgi:hypothetical protein
MRFHSSFQKVSKRTLTVKTGTMRYAILLFLLVNLQAYSQLTIKQAQDSLRKYHLGVSTYFSDFMGHDSYGAGVSLTKDGGAVGFGDGDNGLELIKLDITGKTEWSRGIKKQFEEIEPQCVALDNLGNYYVFMLNYNPDGYRGGSERLLCFSIKGDLLWDKMLGPYTLMNNPVVSYVRTLNDGRIEMRGHIVKDQPLAGKDPVYHYWQGWCNSKGVITTKVGEVIDWGNPEWMKKFQPEK